MSEHKSVVVGVEHFRDEDKQVVLLNDFIRDPDVTDHISALWVPKDVLDDRDRAAAISQIACSAPSFTNARGYDKDRQTFKLIFDTSSSGGVEATLGHIEYITTHHPAHSMTFCVTQTAYAETFDALQKYAEHKAERGIDVSFLLAAPYPENDISKVEKLEDEPIERYVGRLSLNADNYGMGMVGAADLARYTQVGQYYLALGVCVNGARDYEVESRLAPGHKHTKRLTTPEVTYLHSTNTASHVGRTLFEDENGNFQFPYRARSVSEYDNIYDLVKANFLKLLDRLDNLPSASTPPFYAAR